MVNRICLFFPYFGKFNNYFNLWLLSASKNSLIDFYIITDNAYRLEKNMKNIFIINKTLKDIKKMANNILGFNCSLDKPYKLCDYKPLYNLIFNDICKDYDYWGYGDMDIVFGDLNSFVQSEMFSNKLCIFRLGHLSFFKNDESINDIRSLVSSKIIKYVFSTSSICFFDEREYSRYSLIQKKYPDKVFDDYKLIADISPVYSYLWAPERQYTKDIPNEYIFNYKDGKIKGYHLENTKLIEEKFLYIHLMRRKMINKVKSGNAFLICPNRFIEYKDNITIETFNKFKDIDFKSRMVRFSNRVKGKIKRMKKHPNEDIDIVVAWVNGNDPTWLKKKNQYVNDIEKNNPDIGGNKRFKDTGLFKYWFRGIEKYAPWVHKIYLVTDNQIPDFLNVSHAKLEIIDHKEIIDEQYLPVFNSSAICLSVSKIPNLSNNFIFFNDDMFLINPTKKEDFFKNNLPRDMAIQGVLAPSTNDMFWKTRAKLISVINNKFDKKKMIKKHLFKWVSIHYPLKYNIRNLILYKYDYFTDLYNPHIPHSYNKSSFESVYQSNEEEIIKTLSSKFRKEDNLTEWLIRYYQLVQGKFVPTNLNKYGLVMDANDEDVDKQVNSKKYKYLCINNDTSGDKLDKIIKAFENKLGKKSSFEK